MPLLSLKTARRDTKGRFTHYLPYAKKIIVSASFVGLIAGVGMGAIKSSGKVDPGANNRSKIDNVAATSWKIDHEKCTKKTPDGAYDCTDEATKEKIYQQAKQGIRWYTKPETKEEKLEAVCQSKGIVDNDCPRILKAMAMQESGFGKWMVGDAGRSHGFFHILNIHKDVNLECANSLTCSASWTLNRMIRNGYMQNKWHAVGTHNSYTPSVGDAYAKAVKKQLAKL